MDLSDIPFDTPVILRSLFARKSLQNPLGSKKARCLEDNRDVYEQMILRRIRDDKVGIESARNGRFLEVRVAGECVFDPKEPGEWELFNMETDQDCALYFVSCHTGHVLQCDENGIVKCANENRQVCEGWSIVEPRASVASSQVKPVSDLRTPLGGAERQNFILELAKCGKTPVEIEQIVTRLFDAPLLTSSTSPATSVSKSAFAILVDRE
ncbi:hypothetical protein PF005_g7063 [Phytophthora fragariae]|uniref:Uncharacterized protein n=1 Tax=Phytophthora fragariae TaxID=53985 RepID=A0A6A3LIG2_9STRA|nr:hypothetical protein PF003_g9031 [Phytophthora fragariae]KAE8942253.1 hypothetical protein PF009_g7978 [Phytophthora fragariae]KAE9019166.1 hypothetical protein PF011_g5949 [Phytophthora fragariae]KAE9122975.1 hypothetical protein PF007_g7241 [Phytophthora fragariae]KAE9123561.1 hypothetical protein PF010_g6359 [Phytophthora fragariae]